MRKITILKSHLHHCVVIDRLNSYEHKQLFFDAKLCLDRQAKHGQFWDAKFAPLLFETMRRNCLAAILPREKLTFTKFRWQKKTIMQKTYLPSKLQTKQNITWCPTSSNPSLLGSGHGSKLSEDFTSIPMPTGGSAKKR